MPELPKVAPPGAGKGGTGTGVCAWLRWRCPRLEGQGGLRAVSVTSPRGPHAQGDQFGPKAWGQDLRGPTCGHLGHSRGCTWQGWAQNARTSQGPRAGSHVAVVACRGHGAWHPGHLCSSCCGFEPSLDTLPHKLVASFRAGVRSATLSPHRGAGMGGGLAVGVAAAPGGGRGQGWVTLSRAARSL